MQVENNSRPTADGNITGSPFDQISPAALDLAGDGNAAARAQSKVTDNSSLLIGGLFTLLISLVLAVVFVLPRVVEQKAQTPVNDVGGVSTQANTQARKPPQNDDSQRSPFQEAQLAKQRKAAQAILEQLLQRQDELENLGVQDWGADMFAESLQQAQTGDELYRAQEFDAALGAYENALQQLDNLLQSTDEVLAQALKNGNAALDAGNSEIAMAAFQRALRIDSKNEEAQNGMQRSTTLDEVLVQVAAAAKLEKANKLAAALEKYQAALTLDAQTSAAKQGVSRIQDKIKNNKFTVQMSTGYQALGTGQYEKSRQAFQEAVQLKPASAEAKEALSQAQTQLSVQKIGSAVENAEALAAREEWSAAVEKYRAALAVDDSLIGVRKKLGEAQTRAKLDAALQKAIEEPERLSSESVFQATQTVLGKAKSIPQAGPRLAQQIEKVEEQLRKSQIPVPVQLQSDNATNVTILKVKRLGTFEQEQLRLKPGNYVAVGSRENYRDVRREFRVLAGETTTNIVVQCVEKI